MSGENKMTDENQNKLEKILKSAGKIVVGVGIAAAIYSGSLHNTKGFWPFYTEVTGKQYGITIAATVDVKKDAKVYGIVAAGVTRNAGEINGIEACVFNLSTSTGNYNSTINGVQLGLVCNAANKLKGAQIGLVNKIESKGRVTLGLNASIGENYEVAQSTGAK
jgi:hypothetical protein